MGSLRHPRRTELSIFKGRSSETTTDELLTVTCVEQEWASARVVVTRKGQPLGPTKSPAFQPDDRVQETKAAGLAHRSLATRPSGWLSSSPVRRDSMSSRLAVKLELEDFFCVPQTIANPSTERARRHPGHLLFRGTRSPRSPPEGGAWRVASDQSFEGSAAPLGCCRRGRYYPAPIRRQAREKMFFCGAGWTSEPAARSTDPLDDPPGGRRMWPPRGGGRCAP